MSYRPKSPGQRIELRRTELGLTQGCDGLSQPQWSKLEHDLVPKPRLRTKLAVARYLDVDVEDLWPTGAPVEPEQPELPAHIAKQVESGRVAPVLHMDKFQVDWVDEKTGKRVAVEREG